jgi:uncharacterized UBP type Zn finger protein
MPCSMEGLAAPSEADMQEALKAAAWAANRDKLPQHVVPRGPADRVGLVNMGNTCYFNSVVQVPARRMLWRCTTCIQCSQRLPLE